MPTTAFSPDTSPTRGSTSRDEPPAPTPSPRSRSDGVGGSIGIHPQTLAEVTAEVAREVLATHRHVWSSLARTVYVENPALTDCDGAVRCQPLLPASSAPGGSALHGHLHEERRDPDDEGVGRGRAVRPVGAGRRDAGPRETAAPLAVVAELIAAGVARDLFDCLAAAERHRSEQLAFALVTNRRIAMAQGVVMALLRLTPDQAMDRLKESSQNHNRKLRDVAESVILTGALPPWQAAEQPRGARRAS